MVRFLEEKMTNKLKHQLKWYVISGILATSSDLIVYSILTHYGLGYSTSKSISFLCGTVVAFFYNKHKTFKMPHHNIKEVIKFFTLYVTSMACNVFTNHLSIKIFLPILQHHLALLVAFCFATLVSMSINFLGQKFWVFKK